MRKRFLFVIVCLFMFSTIISAQAGYRDVVYLKNGGKVIGIIIEQIPNVSIKIETSNGSIMVFKLDEVERMVKEKTTSEMKQKPVEQNIEVAPPPVEKYSQSTTQSKYQIEGLSASFAGGIHNIKASSTETLVNGINDNSDYGSDPGSYFIFIAQIVFQSRDNLAFLFGGTVDKYANGVMTSYYLGGKYFFSTNVFSPFIYLKGGYGFGDFENHVNKEDVRCTGPYFSGGGGAKYYLGKSWGLYGEVGYKYQGTSAEWEYKDYFDRVNKVETTRIFSGFQFVGGIFLYP